MQILYHLPKRYQDIELFTATQIHPVFCLACPTQYILLEERTESMGMASPWLRLLDRNAVSMPCPLLLSQHTQVWLLLLTPWIVFDPLVKLSNSLSSSLCFLVLYHPVLPLQESEGRHVSWFDSVLLVSSAVPPKWSNFVAIQLHNTCRGCWAQTADAIRAVPRILPKSSPSPSANQGSAF